MRTIQTRAKLVIEYSLSNNPQEQSDELKQLLKELCRRDYIGKHSLSTFQGFIEGEYVYQCGSCLESQEERRFIFKCPCGTEICDNCGYEQDDEVFLCEPCNEKANPTPTFGDGEDTFWLMCAKKALND